MRNYFTFDKFDSRDFGVYISGTETFSAPTREYENISVPGRNGDLLGIENRLENVTLTYPAFMYADYRKNMANLRSALLSVVGYARLYDTYHPDEYRLAVYKGGLEPNTVAGNYAGEFDITFECLPQRFLIDGEKVLTYPPGVANSKNLLPYPYYQTTRTVNGVTFTDNGDGTITVDGTATATCYFYCHRDSAQHAPFLDTGEYIMSGCPQGGSYGGYSMYMYIDEQYKYDYGRGRAISVDADDKEVSVVIQVANGATVNNKVFRPMIRNAYENLLTLQSGSTTINDVVFTVGSDSSVNVDGTATANINFALIPNISSSTFAVHGEKYVISTGMSEAGGADKWFINGQLYDNNKANGAYMHTLLGADTIYQSEYTVDTSVKGASGYFGGFYLRIAKDLVCDNLTFKPMIRLVSETDSQWIPYYEGATSVFNPTLFDAFPLIRVYGYGVLGFGDYTITIASHNYPYIDIDCDLMECYYGTTNCNSLISFSSVDFPVLAAGVSGITYENTITKIEITPRTWRP